jgi:protein-disulfide isomerase
MSKRREQAEQQRAVERKQTLIILSVIAFLAVVLIGGAVLLNSRQTQSRTFTIVNEAPPANADKNGRGWGPVDAPIKITSFVDSQCPGCGQYAQHYEPEVVKAFAGTGKVRYEVRTLAFIGQESVNAAKASLCAMDQDKFWQMHATIFANQVNGENMGDFTVDNLKEMASKLGLDMNTFNTCLSSTQHEDQIKQDAEEAGKLGVNQTPTFEVNGKLFVGARNVEDFRQIFAQVAPDVTVP